MQELRVRIFNCFVKFCLILTNFKKVMQEFVFFITKYTVIFACAVYAYSKLLKSRLYWWDIFSVPIFILFSVVLYVINDSYFVFNALCLFIMTIMYLLIRFRHNFYCIISAGLMALGMATYLRAPAYLIILPINAMLFFIENLTLRNLLAHIVLGVVQFSMLYFLFRFKKFKHNINFNEKSIYSFLLNIANILCIFTGILVNTDFVSNPVFELGEFAIAFFGISILFLYRKNSIDSYIRQQAIIERVLVEKSIEAYGKRVYVLERENEIMGKIIHRDNKILPALETAVVQNLKKSNDEESAELLQTVCRYSAERGDDLDLLKQTALTFPQTHVAMIDAILYDLTLQCENAAVDFSVELLSDIREWFADESLDRTSMNVLISYLGDNAIKSAATISDGGKVKIVIGGAEGNAPFVRVYDNGEPFHTKVLANMGIARITTRKETGGNGYGLQTLFETVRRFDASFTLDEIPCPPYTKFVEVYFDGQHRIVLHSHRGKSIKAVSGRSDFAVDKR